MVQLPTIYESDPSLSLVIEFNLGPPFMLEDLAKEIFMLKKKSYIYKRKADGSLVSHFSQLADVEEGSSIKTYRKKQVDKAHLPVALWAKEKLI